MSASFHPPRVAHTFYHEGRPVGFLDESGVIHAADFRRYATRAEFDRAHAAASTWRDANGYVRANAAAPCGVDAVTLHTIQLKDATERAESAEARLAAAGKRTAELEYEVAVLTGALKSVKRDLHEQEMQTKAAYDEVEKAEDSRQLWKRTADEYARDLGYYRGLLVEIGQLFGFAARISDDGSVQDEVLVAKMPDLVRALMRRHAQAEADARGAATFATGTTRETAEPGTVYGEAR